MAASSQPGIDRRALGAALLTIVLWSSAFVGIRDVAGTFSPGSIALGRLTIGTLGLGAFMLARGWRPISRRVAAQIVGSGLLWFALYNLTLNEAEHHVDAGTASMLVNTGPIFLALFAGIFLGERMPRRLLAGLAVAFAGSLIIGFATSEASDTAGTSVVGIALCFVAAISYAGGVTLQKPALRSVPAIQVTWLACLTGWIVCLPFAPGLIAQLGAAAPSKIAWLAYLGLFPTSIAFTTWAYALKRTSAGRLGSTTYLVPPVVILMAWLLLGEIPPPLALFGGAVCIAGVVVVRSSRLRWPGKAAAAQTPR
jgi:drug/metabolite transporter (DMT)-like permease